jgi:hypothetical protein
MFKEAEALSCKVDSNGHVALHIKSEQLGKAFDQAYRKKTADINGIKQMLTEDEATRELTNRVRKLENQFRKGICTEISRERMHERRRQAPIRRQSNRGNVGS